MAEAVTGGAAVVDSLVANGVRHVFGIPGTHNLELYRYLPASGIRHIVTRHEQGAGYAADGYARVTGGPGVLITTSGPGITNAITALATSYADSVPTLAISPGPPRGMVGKDVGWLHELKNQQAALDAVCDRSIRVENADELPETIADIFAGFVTRRPRPVHLEVPVDVLEGEWVRRPATAQPPSAPGRLDPVAISNIIAALGQATRPLLIAGGGARGAGEEIRALAATGVPVLTTVNGKGILDETDPTALGASVRLRAAHQAIAEADLVIAVGTELGDSDLWGGVLQAAKVIRIDLDPAQLHKNLRADLAVTGDAKQVLQAIITESRFPTDHVAGWRKAITAEADLDAGPWARIQHSLAAALPADTVIAGDSSQVTYYGTVHHWPFTPANQLLYPTGYATLGYGLPAAIGAKIAQPERPVIGLFGDGAAMFTIQELVTATELRLPLPIIVADNGGYAEIREQMVDRGITPQAVDLYQPDLPALARAIGAYGVVAATVESLGDLAAEALTADRPTLIHLAVDGSKP
ncbi:thiamine pyrophosphate-binding protein [Streptomyces sp. SID13031]|uniref:thiamine pyrophosphate-binding protein n=1 Tax=Streptomyces sp. SID13031 TaxID=2706046 RepID=UPI0013CC3399|nr:thiamine pyrophosphate-binding protein [Streptomyces sp. SID13031]NEA35184.1 acetolactate synthase [Streptomyces sp. SID13031]